MTAISVLALHPIVPRFWLLARGSQVTLAFSVAELVERAARADVIIVPAGALSAADAVRVHAARGARTALLAAAVSADDAARQARLDLFDEVLARRVLERQLLAFVVRRVFERSLEAA